MNKYINIDPNSIEEWSRKGYEFVCVWYENSNDNGYNNYNQYQNSNSDKKLEGTFMNNPISLTIKQRPKFLMVLTPAGQALYGEKHDNSGN